MMSLLPLLVQIASISTAVIGPLPSSDTSLSVCLEGKRYVPHPTDCSKFYECVFGVAHLFSCEEGLYFDQRVDVCKWKNRVECHSGIRIHTLETTETSATNIE